MQAAQLKTMKLEMILGWICEVSFNAFMEKENQNAKMQ